ncbi:hypothetical protein [Xanthomonas sacchari]|uniref:hypothetical protein n=1 Tax=Xanthomonas sacchari TaxID=56458 RepID=UPI00225E5922|nr:hypothetical protein [Xanthomonas sacchari]
MKYIMVNENTLCYRESDDQVMVDILASNASGRPWGRGPIFVTPLDVVRPALHEDFARLRVCSTGHLPTVLADGPSTQNPAA